MYSKKFSNCMCHARHVHTLNPPTIPGYYADCQKQYVLITGYIAKHVECKCQARHAHVPNPQYLVVMLVVDVPIGRYGLEGGMRVIPSNHLHVKCRNLLPHLPYRSIRSPYFVSIRSTYSVR